VPAELVGASPSGGRNINSQRIQSRSIKHLQVKVASLQQPPNFASLPISSLPDLPVDSFCELRVPIFLSSCLEWNEEPKVVPDSDDVGHPGIFFHANRVNLIEKHRKI